MSRPGNDGDHRPTFPNLFPNREARTGARSYPESIAVAHRGAEMESAILHNPSRVEADCVPVEAYRRLVDGLADEALFLLDGRGRIASWNPAAERMTGYGSAPMIHTFLCGGTTCTFGLVLPRSRSSR